MGILQACPHLVKFAIEMTYPHAMTLVPAFTPMSTTSFHVHLRHCEFEFLLGPNVQTQDLYFCNIVERVLECCACVEHVTLLISLKGPFVPFKGGAVYPSVTLVSIGCDDPMGLLEFVTWKFPNIQTLELLNRKSKSSSKWLGLKHPNLQCRHVDRTSHILSHSTPICIDRVEIH